MCVCVCVHYQQATLGGDTLYILFCVQLCDLGAVPKTLILGHTRYPRGMKKVHFRRQEKMKIWLNPVIYHACVY